MHTTCQQCGNNHYGPCATEETCFIWKPEAKEAPNEVLIAGSWTKWQTVERLNKQTNENGEVYFRISLSLLAGTYEYKYIIDNVWRHDHKLQVVDDQHGSYNNQIKVFPKKKFVPILKDNCIKISSGLLVDGLKIVGSWDNWTTQITMQKVENHLKGREEYVAYIQVEPGKEYQFRFKRKKQWLIDEKYPTISNCFNSFNNVIITYQIQKQATSDIPETGTPVLQQKINKEFGARTFEWETISREFELPYRRVQGHTMCSIGDYIYIFGGYCRSQFYNSLTKVNTQFTSAKTEEALPNGRAFHNMVTYGNKIIVYGGHNKTVVDDYYSFNVTEEKWAAVPHISGKYPSRKEKQSCVIYEMLLVFFGGYFCSPDIEYEEYYRDISVLDIQNMKWVDHISVKGEQPQGRFAHSASLVGTQMYIFGGTYNTAENLNLNDIWKINLEKVSELEWIELKPKGLRPTARHGHSMNALHCYLIVFGGQNNQSKYLNDIYIFNTSHNEWFEPIINGSVPRPRFYHASTAISNDQIVVFGGRTKEQKNIENIYILKPSESIPAIDENQDQ